MKTRTFVFAMAVTAALSLSVTAFGQGELTAVTSGVRNDAAKSVLEAEAYSSPNGPIADFINAPRHKNTTLSNLSPNRKVFLISESAGMPTLNEMGKPWFNLAGIQIDPAANRARSMTTGGAIGLSLLDYETGKKTAIEVPKDARVGAAAWSPDGSKLAFFVHTATASHLAVADCATGRSRIVTRTPLLATQVTRAEWSADGKYLFAVFIPDDRGPEPKSGPVASSPQVRMGEPTKNQTRTYRSLLQDTTDQARLEYFLTGQLAKVDVGNGKVEKIGVPAMYRSIDPSPDGKLIRRTLMLKPFSYIVPASNFGSVEEIVDESGKQIHEVRKQNLRVGAGGGGPDPNGIDPSLFDFSWFEQVGYEFLMEQGGPGGGQGRGRGGFGGGGGQGGPANSGRRNLGWAPDGNGMIFLQLEAAPRREGEEAERTPQTPRPRKDRLMRWAAPYGANDVKPIYEVEGSISSAQWGSDGKTLFVTESAGGNTTTYAVSLSDPSKKQAIQTRRTPAPAAAGAAAGTGPRPGGPQATDDFYDNPGTWVTDANENGVNTILVSSKGEIYLQGTQYYRDPEKEAPRPFLDAVSLADGKKRRVWQSSADVFETIGAMLDADANRFVLNRQSATMLPNSYLASTSGGEPKALTFNTDYAPDVTGAQRHRIRVERADGFKFWVEVTVPRNHVKGDRLPAFFWFYPSEFNDQAGYDRGKRTFNKNTFPAVGTSSKDLLVLLGYAVVEPDCPIVGPAGRMNDSYVPDLRSNLYAIINVLEKEGYIDRNRLGLGGHSYGAFSTANAMIQTPFFKAGIAGDGAYNRMLTPMAFQSEQRLLWEARETYLTMSPLLYAEQFNGALLMYHGIDDQNVGTHPINSERMFHALDGLGKTVAMYMYPYEDHGPAAKETHLDLWARWVAWLDKYVKGSP